MKNFEVTHTLRLYDAEWVAKLGVLMERTQKYYRNKNEFMTVLLKMGYESYIAAEKAAQNRETGKRGAETVSETAYKPLTDPIPESAYKPETETVSGSAGEPDLESLPGAAAGRGDETVKGLHVLLDELSTYMTAQFRHMHVNQALFRRILSSVYNMILAQLGGNMPPPEQVERGFFDDLPVRFEKIIVNLEKQYGLKT